MNIYLKEFAGFQLKSKALIICSLALLSIAGCVRLDLAGMKTKLPDIVYRSEIPQSMSKVILSDKETFLKDLSRILSDEQALYVLVDKKHPLSPMKYRPTKLVALRESSYKVSQSGMLLRSKAQKALKKMAKAAKAKGITLTVASAYRSYEYQAELHKRNIAKIGQKEAERGTAYEGHSQHQTGLAVDFYPIADSFAETDAGKWLVNNAGTFGFSLSFPKGYEGITGYRWEPWHFRYVGVALSTFIDKWFGSIQQYALQFIDEWEKAR